MDHAGFMLKQPLVPDVHTGIAAGVAGHMSGQVPYQWPREDHRHAHIGQHGGDVGEPSASSHQAGGGTLTQQ